jgi:surface polysaccharide O-acyltransferase-like enzyme
VLLALDGIAAALFVGMPRWGEGLARIAGRRRPIVFFALLVCLSAAAYVPLAAAFTPYRWSSFGPFFFQTSRGLNYLLYFFVGAGVGAYGIDRGLLAPDGKLARRWPLWSVAALLAFAVATGVGLAALTAHLGSRPWEIAGDITFVISCAASSCAFLAGFVRCARTRRKVWDSLAANAYGIYLIHYAFVSWLQLALVKSHLAAIAKGSLVFVGAVLLGWATTAGLRRIPSIARVI